MQLAIKHCLILSVFVAIPFAKAQYQLITVETPFITRSLTGVVVDPTGAPIEGVVVEQCDALFTPIKVENADGTPTEWRGECGQAPGHVVASTKTDEKGRIAFPKAKLGKNYYLHLSAPGFDPMQIEVRLRSHAAAALRIELHIAT